MCKESKVDLTNFLTKILNKIENRAKDLYNNYLYVLKNSELKVKNIPSIISAYSELKKEYDAISRKDMDIIYYIESEQCIFNSYTNKYMISLICDTIELSPDEYQNYINKLNIIDQFEQVDSNLIETYKRFVKKYFKGNKLKKSKLNKDIFFVNGNADKNLDYIK